MLPAYITRIAAVSIIPKALGDLYDYAFGEEPEPIKETKVKPVTVVDTPADRTRWTKDLYEKVVAVQVTYELFCESLTVPQDFDYLTKLTNQFTGLNKNKRAYLKIWTNKLDPTKLP